MFLLGEKKKQGLTYLCAHLQFLALETQLLAGCYQSPCTELLFWANPPERSMAVMLYSAPSRKKKKREACFGHWNKSKCNANLASKKCGKQSGFTNPLRARAAQGGCGQPQPSSAACPRDQHHVIARSLPRRRRGQLHPLGPGKIFCNRWNWSHCEGACLSMH